MNEVAFDPFVFVMIVSIIFLIEDFPVPPHLIIVAWIGTYALSFWGNFIMVCITVKTKFYALLPMIQLNTLFHLWFWVSSEYCQYQLSHCCYNTCCQFGLDTPSRQWL
jgi:hypothetical protein